MLTQSKKLLNAVKKLYTKVTGGKTTKSNDLPTVIDSMAENYVGGSGGGSGSGSLRTFRVITTLQCSTYDITLNYTSDDNTPFYQPSYDGEKWIGLDTLLNHLKEIFTEGKVVYATGLHDSYYGDLFEFSWGKINPEDPEELEGLIMREIIEGVPSDMYYAKVEANALGSEDFIVDVKVM